MARNEDHEFQVEQMETDALAGEGWEYKITDKPNYGQEDQPIKSAVRGREALLLLLEHPLRSL